MAFLFVSCSTNLKGYPQSNTYPYRVTSRSQHARGSRQHSSRSSLELRVILHELLVRAKRVFVPATNTNYLPQTPTCVYGLVRRSEAIQKNVVGLNTYCNHIIYQDTTPILTRKTGANEVTNTVYDKAHIILEHQRQSVLNQTKVVSNRIPMF